MISLHYLSNNTFNKIFSIFIWCICIHILFSVQIFAKKTFPNNVRTVRNDPEWIISPANPWVLEGGSIMLRLQPSEDIKTTSCQVTTPQGKEFKPSSLTESGTEFTIENGPDKVRIGKISSGGCYTLHTSISKANSNGDWTIVANNQTSYTTGIVTLSPPSPSKAVETSIGGQATIDCSSSISYSLFYCRILNNTGNVVSHECKHTINPVRKEHSGNWTCLMAFRGSMLDVRYDVPIVLLGGDYLEGKVLTERTKTRLQCSLKNSKDRFNWCRATPPQGSSFLLSAGLVEGRYSAIDTSVENRVCSLEIDPVSESDHGIWRIELGSKPTDYTGCFLSLPVSKGYEGYDKASLTNKAPDSTVVNVGSNLNLECSVPWPASYCYAIKPDGTPIQQDSNFSGERLLKIGVCLVTAKNLTEADAGRWTCGLSSNDGSEDVHFYTDVEVMSGQLAPVLTGLRPVSGDSMVLLCRSPLHRPLKYCRFINPQGKGFSFKPNVYPESRFSYYGAGLDEGECGIQIKEVTSEDIGTWTCATTFVSFYQEEFATITISKLEPSTGFKVGIGIASASLLAIIIAGVTLGFRRRLKRKNTEHQRILRQTPTNSFEQISQQNNGVENSDTVYAHNRVLYENRPVQRILGERDEIN